MNTLRKKVQLIGRLDENLEIMPFIDTIILAKFSFAIDDSYKDRQGNKVDHTYWHNVVDHMRNSTNRPKAHA